MKIKLDAEIKAKRLELDTLKAADASAVQRERIAAEDKREGARLGVRVAEDATNATREDKAKGLAMGIDIAKELAKNKGKPDGNR
jgi:hypothetical protein